MSTINSIERVEEAKAMTYSRSKGGMVMAPIGKPADSFGIGRLPHFMLTCRLCGETDDLKPVLSLCSCQHRQHSSCLMADFVERGQWWRLTCPMCEQWYSNSILLELSQRGLDETKRKARGGRSMETVVTMTAAADAYIRLDRDQEGRDMKRKALEMLECVCQQNSLQVFSIPTNGYGEIAYDIVGDAARHRDMLQRALHIAEQGFGVYHRSVAVIMASLGTTCGRLGDSLQKKTMLERSYSVLERNPHPNYREVAALLVGIASACSNLGDSERQLELLLRASNLLERNNHPDRKDNSDVLTHLAVAYGALGYNIEQKETLQRAIEIVEGDYGPTSPEVAVLLGHLANAHCRLGDYENQKVTLERAMLIEAWAVDLDETDFGPSHREVAVTLTNLGIACCNLGDVERGRGYLERALEIKEREYGPNHRETAVTLANLSITKGKLTPESGSTSAVRLLGRARGIFAREYGELHPRSQLQNENAALALKTSFLGEALEAKDIT